MSDETPRKPQCWLLPGIQACSERGAEMLFDVSTRMDEFSITESAEGCEYTLDGDPEKMN